MKLRCPIPQSYLQNGKICYVNQLFGENKNSLFYDSRGHRGVDLRTTGHTKYKRHKQSYKNGKWTGNWKAEARDKWEKLGRIPIVAAHEGRIRLVLNKNKEEMGWGLFVIGDPVGIVQYRTLYWHVESPWRSLRKFTGTIVATITRKRVKGGSPVAIGGNNGMSTGPHLHFSLDRRKKVAGQWTPWKRIDPMPFFGSRAIVFQRQVSYNKSKWFYMGKPITATKAKSILKSLPQVI